MGMEIIKMIEIINNIEKIIFSIISENII